MAFARDGAATTLAGGDAFWNQPAAELERVGARWLVSEYRFAADWPSWEMHPAADELVCLLEGAADLLLQMPDRIVTVALVDRGAVVVARGIWHTARVHRPCRMLHVTMGRGTEVRPAAA